MGTPPIVLRAAVRILLESFLGLFPACEGLVGRAVVLGRCPLLVDCRVGGSAPGPVGVGFVLVDGRGLPMIQARALVGVRRMKMRVRSVLLCARDGIDRSRIHHRSSMPVPRPS
jgi:hypothetical protein